MFIIEMACNGIWEEVAAAEDRDCAEYILGEYRMSDRLHQYRIK